MILRLLGIGLLWTIATFSGFTVATFAGVGSFLGITSALGCDVRSVASLPNLCNELYCLVLALAALVGGAGLGLDQFAALSFFQIPTRALWVPATALGFAIPVSLAVGLPVGATDVGATSFFILLGLSLGTAQWFILRLRTSGSVIWIPGTLASTIIAGLTSRWTIGAPISWFVVSAGSALVLLWLLRPSKPRRSVDTAA